MALFGRPSAAQAMYARVIDGEHMWLAVRGEGPLVLRREGADDLEVPTTLAGDLLTSVFPLAAAVAQVEGDVELRLFSGSGRTATPVALAAQSAASPAIAEPPSSDGNQWSVADMEGAVVVRRTKVSDAIRVLAIRSVEGGVEITVDRRGPVAVRAGAQDCGELAAVDGVATVGQLPDLPTGTTATLSIDGVHLSRRSNVLTRPNFAVALPPMLEPDVELRWLKDGRLAVHRSEAQS